MRLRLLLIAALIASGISARADTIYTFTISGVGAAFNGTFVFDEPAILTSLTTISAANVTVTGPPILDIIVDPLVSGCPLTVSGMSCVEVDFSSGAELATGFTSQLTSPGTYNGINTSLVITSTTTPEPSTVVLAGTGLLGLIGAARRKIWRNC